MKTDKILVIAMAISFIITGIVEPSFPNPGQMFNETGAIQSILMAILLFAWCKAHAAANKIKIPTGAPILVAIIAPIGIPYYFFRGFGWRKGFSLLLLAIITFLCFSVLYAISFTLSMAAHHQLTEPLIDFFLKQLI